MSDHTRVLSWAPDKMSVIWEACGLKSLLANTLDTHWERGSQWQEGLGREAASQTVWVGCDHTDALPADSGAGSSPWGPVEKAASTIPAWRTLQEKRSLWWAPGGGGPLFPPGPLYPWSKGHCSSVSYPQLLQRVPPSTKIRTSFHQGWVILFTVWETWLREQIPCGEGTRWRQLIPLKY